MIEFGPYGSNYARIVVHPAQQAGGQIILCLRSADGRVQWQREYPSRTYAQHRDNGYATATPAVDAAGILVTWSTPEEVVLLAVDLDGGEVWRRDFGSFVSESGSGSSPVLYEDLVVLDNDQDDPSLDPGYTKDPPEPPGTSSLIAVDRQTGQTRWQVNAQLPSLPMGRPACIKRRTGGGN